MVYRLYHYLLGQKKMIFEIFIGLILGLLFARAAFIAGSIVAGLIGAVLAKIFGVE
jgi:hypothetical protein